MAHYRKLSPVVYHCNYHIVSVPTYRFRILDGAVKELGERDIHVRCSWKEVREPRGCTLLRPAPVIEHKQAISGRSSVI